MGGYDEVNSGERVFGIGDLLFAIERFDLVVVPSDCEFRAGGGGVTCVSCIAEELAQLMCSDAKGRGFAICGGDHECTL